MVPRNTVIVAKTIATIILSMRCQLKKVTWLFCKQA